MWDHGKYKSLQREYWIPQNYSPAEEYFNRPMSVYHNRPMSVYEYYDLVCSDNPGYVKGYYRGNSTAQTYPVMTQAARQPIKSASSTRPVAHNPGFQRPNPGAQPNVNEDEALARWRRNIVVDSQGNEKSSADDNSTQLTTIQIQAAEQTERERKRAANNPKIAPVPEDEDSTEDTEYEDELFDNHLFPQDKLRIAKLKREHTRTKTGVFSKSYLTTRDREIKAAELVRMSRPHIISGRS
jgi:hypothetical protein